jgi:hypothetical protein
MPADIYPPQTQRTALRELVEALGCRDSCLRRDERGDWRVVGKLGHIYAVPGTLDRPKIEGFLIYFRGALEVEEPTSSQGWTWCKKALEPFFDVCNDGDEEGMLFLDHPPTAAEAEIIRDKLGIAKKRATSEAELERLRRQGFQSHYADESSGKKLLSARPAEQDSETASGGSFLAAWESASRPPPRAVQPLGAR